MPSDTLFWCHKHSIRIYSVQRVFQWVFHPYTPSQSTREMFVTCRWLFNMSMSSDILLDMIRSLWGSTLYREPFCRVFILYFILYFCSVFIHFIPNYPGQVLVTYSWLFSLSMSVRSHWWPCGLKRLSGMKCLSWSRGHGFEPQSGRTRDCVVFLSNLSRRYIITVSEHCKNSFFFLMISWFLPLYKHCLRACKRHVAHFQLTAQFVCVLWYLYNDDTNAQV